MKKIFTLMMAMLAFGGVASAQEEVDIPLSEGWGWGWSVETAYADGIVTATLTGAYGAFSTGWDGGADWSSYNKLTVVLESYNNDWGKVYFSDAEGKTVVEQSFGTITSTTSIAVSFEPSAATAVKQLAIQGKAAGDVIKVSRVFLTKAVEYEEEGVTIEFDDWGNITSDKFAGFDDQAKVVFTYLVEGELTNDNGSIVGWGIGSIKSLDESVVVAEIAATELGTQSYTTTVGDLKAALEAPANQYNLQGINWNVWNQGNATVSRVSVVVYDVKKSEPEPSVDYEAEGVTIEFDEWGNITSDKFAGFSKQAKVVFTFLAEGEAVNDNGQSVIGWNIGSLKSLDGSVVVASEIPLVQIGEFTYETTVGDLQEALAAPANEYNMQGIYWNVWGQGHATVSRKSVEVFEVKGASTGVSELRQQGASSQAVYNLAGQRVVAGQKGIVVRNGKKYVVK